jgi:hypothetical protein
MLAIMLDCVVTYPVIHGKKKFTLAVAQLVMKLASA